VQGVIVDDVVAVVGDGRGIHKLVAVPVGTVQLEEVELLMFEGYVAEGHAVERNRMAFVLLGFGQWYQTE
jgi:hypothetical protein